MTIGCRWPAGLTQGQGIAGQVLGSQLSFGAISFCPGKDGMRNDLCHPAQPQRGGLRGFRRWSAYELGTVDDPSTAASNRRALGISPAPDTFFHLADAEQTKIVLRRLMPPATPQVVFMACGRNGIMTPTRYRRRRKSGGQRGPSGDGRPPKIQGELARAGSTLGLNGKDGGTGFWADIRLPGKNLAGYITLARKKLARPEKCGTKDGGGNQSGATGKTKILRHAPCDADAFRAGLRAMGTAGVFISRKPASDCLNGFFELSKAATAKIFIPNTTWNSGFPVNQTRVSTTRRRRRSKSRRKEG